MVSLKCSECIRLFPEAQELSVKRLIGWLNAWMFAQSNCINVPLDEVEVLCAVSDSPDCLKICAHDLPPLFRDEVTAGSVVPHVVDAEALLVLKSVEIEALIQRVILTWFQPEVVVDKSCCLGVGKVGRSAVMLVNNLLYAANPGPTGLRTDTPFLIQEVFKTFKRVTARALAAEERGEQLLATDLIVLNWLNTGVRRICEGMLIAPKPVAPQPVRAGLKYATGVFAVLALGGLAVAGGFMTESQMQVRVSAGVLACLSGLITIAGVWFCGRRVAPTPPDAAWAWAYQLKDAIVATGNTFDQCVRGDANSLARWDLLADAGSLFRNTLLGDTHSVARFMIRIITTPAGPSLVRWIARQAVSHAGLARVCEVAEALCDEDEQEHARGAGVGELPCEGAGIATCLVREFLQSLVGARERERGQLDSQEREKRFWSQFAPVGSKDQAGTAYDFPRVLRRLLYRAALCEGRKVPSWTERESQFVFSCRELAAFFLLSGPKTDGHWHLLQIRFLADAMKSGLDQLQFPSRTACSLIQQCEVVASALVMFRHPEGAGEYDDPTSLNREHEAAHGAADETDDPIGRMRDVIVREALAVMSSEGFILPKSYLPQRPDVPKWHRSYLKPSKASLLDRYVHCRFVGDRGLSSLIPNKRETVSCTEADAQSVAALTAERKGLSKKSVVDKNGRKAKSVVTHSKRLTREKKS